MVLLVRVKQKMVLKMRLGVRGWWLEVVRVVASFLTRGKAVANTGSGGAPVDHDGVSNQ